MDTQTYPDPFREAAQHAIHRAVQVASVAVTAAQVYVYQQKTQERAVAERGEHGRRALQAPMRADREAARARWAPALDPAWLREASLLQTARAWGAAMPFADRAVPWYEPAAATALRKCEERLRELHPHAMARYDRLRAEGMGPAEAMADAAPLFARPPRTHDGSFTPRPVLTSSPGPVAGEETRPPAPDPGGEPGAGVTRRGRPWDRDFPLPIREVLATLPRPPRPMPGGGPAAPIPARRRVKAGGARP